MTPTPTWRQSAFTLAFGIAALVLGCWFACVYAVADASWRPRR